jgi:uncharacterized membrane protein
VFPQYNIDIYDGRSSCYTFLIQYIFMLFSEEVSMAEDFDSMFDSASVDPVDAEKNKIVALLSYLGLLVIVPILAARESRFAMYHANQGLILLIIWVGLWFLSFIPLLNLLTLIAWIFPVVLSIMGILNVLNGRMKPLPLLGHLQIIK